MLNNACLIRKTGYFLSLRQWALVIGGEKLEPLLNAKPHRPLYASKRKRTQAEGL